jgi:hypothetical protein
MASGDALQKLKNLIDKEAKVDIDTGSFIFVLDVEKVKKSEIVQKLKALVGSIAKYVPDDLWISIQESIDLDKYEITRDIEKIYDESKNVIMHIIKLDARLDGSKYTFKIKIGNCSADTSKEWFWLKWKKEQMILLLSDSVNKLDPKFFSIADEKPKLPSNE